MIVAIVLVCSYIAMNKYIKGHSMDRFISAGLKRKADRILFATVIIICALYSYRDIPSKPGLLLLLSCLGVALWDYSYYLHYIAAFGVAFVVSYIIHHMARDTVDMTFIIICVIFITILLLGALEQSSKEFISQIEHMCLIFAAFFFIKKYIERSHSIPKRNSLY